MQLKLSLDYSINVLLSYLHQASELQTTTMEMMEAVDLEKQKHNNTRMEALQRLAKLEVLQQWVFLDSFLHIFVGLLHLAGSSCF